MTQKYAEMEKNIRLTPEITKNKKEQLRFRYEKHQISLEQTFEACSNLLFFFIDLESAGTNTNT